MKINPLLQSDFYKQVHWNQYDPSITKIVSYWVPRGTRIKDWDKYVFFGLQSFIKEFLIEDFNEYFFRRPIDDVMREYSHLMNNTLGGENIWGPERIRSLHRLGYLPIEIKALPEGSRVPLKVPMLEISNTHPDFAWITNAIESVLSCEMWHGIISANVGYEYRKIVDKYYDETCDDTVAHNSALGDFSMRGQESMESATKSSAAWLLSFVNTATIPAIPYLEKYYRCNCEKEVVGRGLSSTEHSVMNSSYAIDGDEITMVKRLLTSVYPENSFTMVSDSYDYWNLVENILPQCKEEILNHKGFIGIRGDSGDPVSVVTKTVEALWNIFGGTVNSKGYKVLDSHVKAIYGDSITIIRAQKIYEILKDMGFAANNVSLGVGSFSMQCFEDIGEDGTTLILNPFTRDTGNFAIKCTYCETRDGKEIPVFKAPKENSFKRSNKGCCVVYTDELGEYYCVDMQSFNRTEIDPNNKLELVFKDGIVYRNQSLAEIRDILYGGKF